MAFELVVEMKSSVTNLRQSWQEEFNSHGFSVEILPSFDPKTWRGGLLPIKLAAMPGKYLFGLPEVIQISGFEVSFGVESAHFRTANGRTLAELILQCHGAASLAVITNGIYLDLQTGESFTGKQPSLRPIWRLWHTSRSSMATPESSMPLSNGPTKLEFEKMPPLRFT